jgi:WD40-like Beta Propeller Repeat
MRAVKLGDLRSHGLALTAHEGVSVVHEVCRLMQEAAQHDRPISAPTLNELFVDETGHLIIEPVHPSQPGSDSLTRLIDELLPERIDDLKPEPHEAWARAGEPSANRERAVLRALYQRVSAVSSPMFEPESQPADDPWESAPLPVDDSLVWIDTQADAVPADEPDIVDEPRSGSVEPLVAAETAAVQGSRSGWLRRAVLWGAAIDAVLALTIGLKLGLIPNWTDLVDRVSARADAGESPPVPALPAAMKPREGEPAVQQLPDASSATTPESFEAPEAAGTLARRGILIPASAPAASLPNIIEGADHTTLSPDGLHIAFDLDRDGVRGVFVADRHGRNIALASGEGRAAAPIWSPDAEHLAFVRAEPDRPMVWNLWMRHLSTGSLTRLTDYRSGIIRGASWFPDGRRICYAHQQTLVIRDVRSGRQQTSRSPVEGVVRTPSVSPDGRRIAFEIEGSGIWMMDLDRRAIEQIIDDPAPSSLAWRPEADGLTYFSLGAREWRAWRPAPPG